MGKGITICQEWLADKQAFYRWADENGWKKGLFLDRINVDLGYSPFNCRFVNPQISAQNRSNNTLTERIVKEARGLCAAGLSVAAAAKKFQVNYGTILDAIRGRTWANVQ